MIRVRFAPSPTGFLHIGAARTAIYNWLFARHHGGTFILRIEDTDTARSSREMSRGILEGLEWLGLDWDEGPIYQSGRIETYRERAEHLVSVGAAYECYCLPGEIQERKQKGRAEGNYWEYDRRCLGLSDEERLRFRREGRPRAIRFRVPDEDLQYTDLIHGPIRIKPGTLEDFVLVRGDGQPTYHLSVVVDDIESRITHIIRGDDHISNTPKQILLYRALGVEPPRFAHQSLILGPDKKKLSKRHGVTSVLQFHEDGILPLALVNYLAQMSWSPGEERIYSMAEMIERFDLEKRGGGHPVFDPSKLEWFNGRLISQLPATDLFPMVEKALREAGLWREDLSEREKPRLLKVIDLLKQRSRRARDFPERARPFLSDDFPMDPAAAAVRLKENSLDELLPMLAEDFRALTEFTAERIEVVLRQRAERNRVKAALLIHAVRVLLLGMAVSPDVFAVIELIGREATLARLAKYSEIKASL